MYEADMKHVAGSMMQLEEFGKYFLPRNNIFCCVLIWGEEVCKKCWPTAPAGIGKTGFNQVDTEYFQ
jgi:hypothetical protein